MAREQRRLAAIVAADVVGYSRLMGRDELGTLASLKSLRSEVIEPRIAENGGRVVKTTGDGLLVEFGSVVDAARCVVAVQQAMAGRGAATAGELAIQFRIGVHMGDIVIDGDDILGDGVNVAARLEALADPGGVCVSGRVQEDLVGKFDLDMKDGGEQTLKNIAKPVRIWRWSPDDRAATPSGARQAEVPAVPTDKLSIAVLPFNNISAAPEQEFFADGIAEDILTTLSKIRHILVIARNSSFTFKGKPVDVRKVGEELGVRYVLEGSVRKAGNMVRVTAQLVDCVDGHHLWADRFDGTLDNVFELQDRITQDIVTALEVELTEGELVRIWRRRSGNPLAYEAYHKARDFFMQFTKEANLRATAEAERAIDINPDYWDAWLILGYTYNMAARFGWSTEPARSLQQAKECVARVLAADDTIPEAHSLAGGIALTSGDYDTAVECGRRAVALGPNSPDCYHMLAMTLCFAGQPEDAVGLERHALRLNPLNPTNSLVDLGRACVQLGRFEDARSVLLQVVARRPRWMNARALLIAACEGAGRDSEAVAQAKEILRTRPSFTIGEWAKLQPYRHSRDLEAILQPLRKAGLPD